MDIVPTSEGGGNTPFNFILTPTHKPETLLEHVRSAVARGLPEVRECKPHDEVLSIVGGGPSLADSYKEITGCIAAVNGSLSWLLGKGIVPQMCGVCDPSEHMADVVEAHKDVAYFIASHVHPKVFDRLLDAGCKVYLWHLHPIDGMDALLADLYPDGWIQVTGGCTMGLRWMTLGYLNGFRRFHFHGLDSSFRGSSSHAYPDHQDQKDWITFDGYPTRLNFLGQVSDFIMMMDNSLKADVEPIDVKVFGDGLLQKRFRDWQAEHGGKYA